MIRKVGEFLYSLITIITAVCLAFMSILVFLNVVLRYVFNSGITWSGELSQIMFVWLVFLGAILAYKDNSHLGVDVVVKRLPKKISFVVYIIGELIFIWILYLLLKGSIKMTAVSMQTLSPATHLPMGYIYGIGILLSVGIGIMLISRFITTLIDVAKGRDPRFNNVEGTRDDLPEQQKSS